MVFNFSVPLFDIAWSTYVGMGPQEDRCTRADMYSVLVKCWPRLMSRCAVGMLCNSSRHLFHACKNYGHTLKTEMIFETVFETENSRQ